MGAGLGVAPRQPVALALDRLAQQPVPGGVEVDLVDAVAVAVVGAQDRLVALAALRVVARLGGTGHFAAVAQAVDAPAAALALEGLAERGVGGEAVVGNQRRGLVRHLMRVAVGDLHGAPSGERIAAHPAGPAACAELR